jgi:hypothetical protein
MRTLADSLEELAHVSEIMRDSSFAAYKRERLGLLGQETRNAYEGEMRRRLKQIVDLLARLPPGDKTPHSP